MSNKNFIRPFSFLQSYALQLVQDRDYYAEIEITTPDTEMIQQRLNIIKGSQTSDYEKCVTLYSKTKKSNGNCYTFPTYRVDIDPDIIKYLNNPEKCIEIYKMIRGETN